MDSPRNGLKGDAPQQVDLYFLTDTTMSMQDVLPQIKGQAKELLNTLNEDANFDFAFGVGKYRDFPLTDTNPYAFIHILNPTKDMAQVTKAIKDWDAGGCGDRVEGQIYALDYLALMTCSQKEEAPIWRPGARRLLLWIGDAPGHDPVCQNMGTSIGATVTESSMISNLIRAQLTVLALSIITDLDFPEGLDGDQLNDWQDYRYCEPSSNTMGQASRITQKTGGIHKQNNNITDFIQDILTLVRHVYPRKESSTLSRSVAQINTMLFQEALSPPEETNTQGITQAVVNWTYQKQSNAIEACNRATFPARLTFTNSGNKILANGNPLPYTNVQQVLLPPSKPINVTSLVNTFQEGQVCFATQDLTDHMQTTAMTLCYLSLGTIIELLPGLTMHVGKDQERYRVTLAHEKDVQVNRVELMARGVRGASVSVRQQITQEADYTFLLPNGTDLDPLIEMLMLTLTFHAPDASAQKSQESEGNS